LTLSLPLAIIHSGGQIIMVISDLSKLAPTEAGRIMRVGGQPEMRRRLVDMGVVAGAMVEVERVAPLGDPVEIRVKGYDLALRKEEARKIQVEVIRGSLSRVAVGEKVVIIGTRAGWGLQRRLSDLGLTPGTVVRMVNSGCPGQVVLEVHGSKLAIGHGVADKIIVRPESDQAGVQA
jgi:ferrous iron transport protein A